MSVQLLIADEKGRDKAAEKANEYLKGRLVELQDIVVSQLQQQTADSLKDEAGREAMKQAILTKIGALIPSPLFLSVKKVLVTEFIIQ